MKRFALILIAILATLVTAQAEPATGLPGVIWELQEITGFDGATITITEPERYTLEFDGTGRIFAGLDCNRGMGNYEVDGNDLELSEIASTLAMCPPDSLDHLYVTRLNDVSSFEVAGNMLALVTADDAQLRFAPEELAPEVDPQAEEAGATSAFAERLRNITYSSEALGQDLPLVAGEFEDHAERVSATLAHVEYSDLDGDGIVDAVVLLTSDGGGTGIFFELFAVLNDTGTAKPVARNYLGDRVTIQNISAAGPLVRIELVTQSADDGMCCASMSVAQDYLFTGNSFYQLPEASEFLDALYNGTYPSINAPNGSFTLASGSYTRESLIAGGTPWARISRVAFGDLDLDGQPDAVVIITSNPGGGVTSFELHSVLNKAGKAVVISSEQLDSDLIIMDLRIEAGMVRLELR